MTTLLRRPDSTHCRRDRCRCTHDYPCDRGWIEAPSRDHNGQTYTRVSPCPVCRHELTARLDEAAILALREVYR